MADNSTLDPGAGGDVYRSKDRTGVKTQVVGLDVNIGGSEVLATGDATNGIDVDVTRVQGTVTVNPTGATAQPVTDNGGSLTVDDGAGSLTVDGSVSLAAAIPAGSNNIGDVDLASAIPAGSATIGAVNVKPATAGGLTVGPGSGVKLISAASTNATSVKASAGQVFGWFLSNTNAAARYLKVYNKASAPTVGTDVPVLTILIPGNTAGAGANVEFTNGIEFATGIAIALTTGVADADTGAVAASEIVVNLFYK